MTSLAWMGTIAWGIMVTLFGMSTLGDAAEGAAALTQAQNVVFLIAAGLVTCLIGTVGLLGFLGWIPALSSKQKTYS